MDKSHGHRKQTLTTGRGETALQTRLLKELQRLVDERYRPALPAFDPSLPFNQPVDCAVRRRGRHFYIMAVLQTPERDGVRERFESPLLRLENTTGNWLSLAWPRHTGKWQTLAAGLTLDQALELIREHPLFEP